MDGGDRARQAWVNLGALPGFGREERCHSPAYSPLQDVDNLPGRVLARWRLSTVGPSSKGKSVTIDLIEWLGPSGR